MNRPDELPAKWYVLWDHMARRRQPLALCHFCKCPAVAEVRPRDTRCDRCKQVTQHLGDFLHEGGPAAEEFVESTLRWSARKVP